MVKDTYALLTGLFVLVLGTAMVVMGLFLGDYGRERDVYVLTTTGAVSGLNPESEVIYRGVKAGKVTTIGFDPDDPRTIRVRIELDSGLPISRGTFALLRVQPLTGLAQVELNDAGDKPEPLTTNAQHPAEIPIRPSLFDRISGSGGEILDEAARIAQRLNAVLDDENQGHLSHALAMLDQSLSELVALERRLGTELGRVPAVDRDLRDALAKHAAAADAVRSTSNQIGQLAGPATDRRLRDTLEGGAEAAQSIRATSERISQLADEAAKLVAQGQQAANTLNTRHLPELQGLLTELRTAAHEELPELKTLLKDLREAAANFRKLSASLERDPRALLANPKPAAPGPGEPGFKEPR
jgi:phospholipid/cholesterol/gamma-HCH transport system substrate-binding protein